ncbi:MAG: glycosyltransferase family 4 protein, partial [Chloroflexi bacterium]|nr:glycosyltransferase family 4 protein [Chloroflexota bacterium]
GWLFEEIEEAIRGLHLGEWVKITGFIPDEDLPALYQGADVFAFPSLYEGFGIPVLEALACGTPVVTSNTSSMPEAAGDAALLVDPTDVEAIAEALWRLLEDASLRNALRARGFEQVKRFSWVASARIIHTIYRHLIEGGA